MSACAAMAVTYRALHCALKPTLTESTCFSDRNLEVIDCEKPQSPKQPESFGMFVSTR